MINGALGRSWEDFGGSSTNVSSITSARSLAHCSSLIGVSEMMYLPSTCSSCWLSRQCCGSRFFNQKTLVWLEACYGAWLENNASAGFQFFALTLAHVPSLGFASSDCSCVCGMMKALKVKSGRTGRFLMVHGGCRSVGCYAMTDAAMEEIYGLVYEAFRGGQEKVQVQALPFRMTAENLARHAEDPNAPFWEMLKIGTDAFVANGRPPTVAVCDQRYVFNPVATGDLDPNASCPPGIEPRLAAAGCIDACEFTAWVPSTSCPTNRNILLHAGRPIWARLSSTARKFVCSEYPLGTTCWSNRPVMSVPKRNPPFLKPSGLPHKC